MLELSRTTYAALNDSRFRDLLEEREGIALSLSTVRRIRRAAGEASPRKRRPPAHRQRRERRSREGMLLQLDGSPHDWLQCRGPRHPGHPGRSSLAQAAQAATGPFPQTSSG